jgi:hypothetical protein
VSELYASVPLSTVPQEKQQDMDIILTIISELKLKEESHTVHCDTLLAHQQEILSIKEDAYRRLSEQQEAYHQQFADHLKGQLHRFRLALIVVLSILIVSYLAFFVVLCIDAPHIGAGGSILP